MQYFTAWSVAFCKPLIIEEEVGNSFANNNTEITCVPVVDICKLSLLMWSVVLHVKVLKSRDSNYDLVLHHTFV
jgi:hypothetical protein